MDIKLRKWMHSDANELATLCNNIDRRFLSDRLPNPYTIDDAGFWLQNVINSEGKQGVFRAITSANKIIGSISIEQKNDVYRIDSDIGYFLLSDFWSKGIMTMAAGEICRIAFENLDIMRISGNVYEENTASRKVLEHNGFEMEGFLHNAVIKDGTVSNLCIYGLLKDAT